MTTFHGVLPALITPFTPDGAAIDVPATRAIVDRCVDAGVGGLVPAGSTGEFTTLTTDERRLLVETVLEAAAGRVPTVAGTGALSTAETVALSVHAEAHGAAAVMVVPPFYDPLTWPDLLAHYTAIADAISIPIMYYNLPSATGVTPTMEQYAELKRVAGVTCFKDTGGDMITATALVQRPVDTPTLLNGYDTLTFAALAAGVEAVVWGVASFLPAECVRLHHLLIDEPDLAAARELWATIWPVCDLLEARPYAAAVKAGCAAVGLATGPVRAPLHDLGADDRAVLAALVNAAGAGLREDAATH